MKENIRHRKLWTFGNKESDQDVIDTFYINKFHKDYVAYDDNGEILAISSNKKRLRRFLK